MANGVTSSSDEPPIIATTPSAKTDTAATPATAVGNTETGEASVVMKGPLSQVFTEALNSAYAKTDPITGSAAMETAAQDTQYMQQLVKDLLPEADEDNAETVVYAVSPAQIDQQVVIDITKEAANQGSDDRRGRYDFVVIIDGTQPGANSEGGSAPKERLAQFMETSLECIAECHGIKVYRSLEEFAKARVQK
jgi:hypothetical protein